MAQKRMVYSNVWESGQVAKLSKLSRLLYIGTITIADDDGRFKTNPSLLRSKIFPFDDDVKIADVSSWLKEIIEVGLIIAYSVGDDEYAFHPNWSKFQKLRQDRKKDSLIPPPTDVSEMSAECQPSDGQKTAKGKVSKGKVSKDKIVSMFDQFWAEYPNKTAKKKAGEKFEVIFKELDDVGAETLLTEILAGLEQAKKSKQWVKDGGQFIPHPTTWLNQERWKDEGVKQSFSTGGSSSKFSNIGKKV